MKNINTQNVQTAHSNVGVNAKDMAIMAMFTAIILIMAFTPFGLIDLPLIKATILHVPVIIGAVVLGPKKGAFLGFLFGLTSLIKNTMAPSFLSFAFTPAVSVPGLSHGSVWAIVICFLPRILVGVTPWLFYYGVTKAMGSRVNLPIRTVLLAISGAIGAITNTGLVMGMIYILFKDAYAVGKGIPVDQVLGVILGVVAGNGIPEMIVAAVLVPVIVIALLRAHIIKNQ